MKTKPTKKGSPPLAAVTCSPALADAAKRIQAKARYYRKSARLKGENGWRYGETHDLIRAEAYKESARIIRQCQESAEVSDRRAHGNENTTGANGGSLH